VLAGVDVRGPQVGHQQLVAAEDVEGEEAVMVIVPVEEAPLLLAMDRVVGGVEVEDQGLGRLGMGGDELVNQDLGDADQGRAVDAVLQAAEGRGRGERPALVGDLPGGQLQSGVGTEGLMVVEVLVAQGDGGDPLSEHGHLVVHDQRGPARVGDGSIEGLEQTESSAEFAEQEGASVGGEPSAPEVGDDGLGAEPGEEERVAATVCHSDGLAVVGSGRVLTRSLQGVRPSRNSPTAARMKYCG
jgi:hypothetical protein